VRRLAEEFRIERGALIDNAFSDVVLRGLYYKGCARSKPEVLINFTDKENQVMTHSEIKSTEFAAYIGIDWADQKHDICLREAGSNRIESLQIDHKPDSISNWVSELRQRFQGRSIAIALEQKRGALLYSLMLYEFIILYPVNPHADQRQLKLFRIESLKILP
jgi:hypothetical protein